MSMLVFWSLQECELLYGDPHGASRLTILTQIVSLCCLVLSDLSSVTFNQLLAACCRRPPAGRARCTKGVRVTDGDHDARSGVAAVPPRLRELSEGEGPHGLYGGQILHLGREPWTAKADRGWIVQPERLVASCWQREWGEFMVSIEQYLSAGLQPQIMNQTTTCRQQHRMSSRHPRCNVGSEPKTFYRPSHLLPARTHRSFCRLHAVRHMLLKTGTRLVQGPRNLVNVVVVCV